jgi:transcriptional regulator with XRE-family HTH domain
MASIPHNSVPSYDDEAPASSSVGVREKRWCRFPNRLRHLRDQQSLTLEQLAARVGCSAKHLSRVELGQLEPHAILLHDLARVLGVLVDCIFDRSWSWERRRRFVDPSSAR